MTTFSHISAAMLGLCEENSFLLFWPLIGQYFLPPPEREKGGTTRAQIEQPTIGCGGKFFPEKNCLGIRWLHVGLLSPAFHLILKDTAGSGMYISIHMALMMRTTRPGRKSIRSTLARPAADRFLQFPTLCGDFPPFLERMKENDVNRSAVDQLSASIPTSAALSIG